MAKYTANPIEVDAYQFRSVSELMENGNRCGELDSGTNYIIEADKMSRMIPVEGDYLVRTHDGYEYLNPAHVFEAKYTKISDKFGDDSLENCNLTK